MSNIYNNKPNPYNPEILEFLEACGYNRIKNAEFPGGAMFMTEDVCVQLWGNKVQVSRNENGFVWNTISHFVGFDGQDLPKFMMLMHVAGAVDLNAVRATWPAEMNQSAHDLLTPWRARNVNNNHKLAATEHY